jgi:hypothetical protein
MNPTWPPVVADHPACSDAAVPSGTLTGARNAALEPRRTRLLERHPVLSAVLGHMNQSSRSIS